MPADKIYVGTAPRFVVQFMDDNKIIDDLAYASLLQIIFTRPDGTEVTRVAELFSDGTDGRIKYDTDPAIDLDVDGQWELQGRVVYSTKPYRSDRRKFVVYP